MGSAAINTSIDDSKLPDWMKHKSLREIEVIRESKKLSVVNSAIGEENDPKDRLCVMPGVIKFINFPLENTFNRNQTFSIDVLDPDNEIFGLRPEF